MTFGEAFCKPDRLWISFALQNDLGRSVLLVCLQFCHEEFKVLFQKFVYGFGRETDLELFLKVFGEF